MTTDCYGYMGVSSWGRTRPQRMGPILRSSRIGLGICRRVPLLHPVQCVEGLHGWTRSRAAGGDGKRAHMKSRELESVAISTRICSRARARRSNECIPRVVRGGDDGPRQHARSCARGWYSENAVHAVGWQVGAICIREHYAPHSLWCPRSYCVNVRHHEGNS